MTQKPLTDLAIQKLPAPQSGQKVYYEPSGLGIRVSQGGTKSFVVQLGSQRRRKTLGRYPQLSLKAARAKAMMFINHADRYAVSYKSEMLIEEFLEDVRNRRKPRTYNDYKRMLEKHFPKMDIQSIDRATLRNIMKGYSHRPGELFHITAVFKTFLNWCVQQDYIEFNPIAGLRNTGRVNHR
ncbi:MAG: integrase arm-type DNA-binding domain-containing protein [Rhizobiaceae bacterium]|nr:integrase arm-type DNA-binding domain-containing protein [Rhizobiaceae bacterium]